MLSFKVQVQEEIDEFAVDLAIARRVWQQCRQLVEAPLSAIPEPLASALGEDESDDDPPPSDLSDPQFVRRFEEWAQNRALDFAHDLEAIIERAGFDPNDYRSESGELEAAAHDDTEFLSDLGIAPDDPADS